MARFFFRDNARDPIEGSLVGDSYLRVCDCASGDFSEEGSLVATGIRSVMSGQKDHFVMEYPCHSPTEQRWFIVRVSRIRGESGYVVVAHENITERNDPHMLCAILLSSSDGQKLLHGAAPSLPDFYNQAIHGVAIGPGTGSCGTAAFTRKLVIVEDIELIEHEARLMALAIERTTAPSLKSSRPPQVPCGRVKPN